MTIILPNDVIENILSYGDPIVNENTVLLLYKLSI